MGDTRSADDTCTPPFSPIGGDYAIDWPMLSEEAGEPKWFSTGRAALVAAVTDSTRTRGTWLVPDFICPVVPRALQDRGIEVKAYPWLAPWSPDQHGLMQLLRTGAVGIVVAFYMGMEPVHELWQALSDFDLCIIEDRCQCVGVPSKESLRGDYAIGSFRKWLAVPDGAYCMKRCGANPLPDRTSNREMIRFRLAAALVKQARLAHSGTEQDFALEQVYVELFRRGESVAGDSPDANRCDWLSDRLIGQADMQAIVRNRLANQAWLASALESKRSVEVLEPQAGAVRGSLAPLLALPVRCRNRDRVRSLLSQRGIYCAVHWPNADWAGQGGRPAEWAASFLSLPIDQRYGGDDLQRIADAIE